MTTASDIHKTNHTPSSSSSAWNTTTRHTNRILFASCHSQHYDYEQDGTGKKDDNRHDPQHEAAVSKIRKNNIWQAMTQRQASAFVWAGDAIYGDDFDYINFCNYYLPRFMATTMINKESTRVRRAWNRLCEEWLPHKSLPRPATPAQLETLYAHLLQKNGPYAHPYRRFVSSQPYLTVLGALDDHDYGCNNGDINFQFKRQSAMAYVNFLTASNQKEDPIVQDLSKSPLSLMAQRASSGKGVYGVKVFDYGRQDGGQHPLLTDEEAGVEPSVPARAIPLSDRSVAIFLLDVRSNKTPWPTSLWTKYFVDYEADFLGSEQWNWLEQAVHRSTAAVNIFVTGLQVHADRFFDGNEVEDWSRFPMAQHRFYQTLLQTPTLQAPVIVSGDVHMAQLLRKTCRQVNPSHDTPEERLLLEVTTSGMTHSWGTNICARPHSTASCKSKLVANSLATGMKFAHHNTAWTDVVHVKDPYDPEAKGGYQYVLERNFGEFEFDWEQRQLIVRVFGEEVDAPPLLSTSWDFDVLSGFRPPTKAGNLSQSDFEDLLQEILSHGANEQDWVCINSGGRQSLLLKIFGVISPIFLAGTLMSTPIWIPALLMFIMLRRMKGAKTSCSSSS